MNGAINQPGDLFEKMRFWSAYSLVSCGRKVDSGKNMRIVKYSDWCG